MSTPIRNNTPQVRLNGIKDESALALVAEPEQIPQHLPLMYIMAAWGPEEPVLGGPGDGVRVYGEEAFDSRSKFFNHQNLLAQHIAGEGNSILYKRVTAGPVAKASRTLVVTLDSTVGVIDSYARDPLTEKVILDGNGDPTFVSGPAVPVVGGVKVKYEWVNTSTFENQPVYSETFTGSAGPGVTLTFVGGFSTSDQMYAVGSKSGLLVPVLDATTNTLVVDLHVDGEDVTVTRKGDGVYAFPATGAAPIVSYPLLTVDANFVGAKGNNFGIRLWTAHQDAANPADADVVDEMQALAFNAQLYTRASAASTAVLVEDIYSSKTQEFMLKPGAYNSKTDEDLTIQNVIDNYSDDGKTTGTTPTYGPLSAITVHQDNLDVVLAALQAAEEANEIDNPGTTGIDESLVGNPVYLIDLFTGVNQYGIHHYGFQIDETGHSITSGRTHWLTEGTDGSTDWSSFAVAVNDEVDYNYQNSAYPLLDSAQYPFSVVYDSGFPMATKEKLMKWTAYRKDVHVTVATQDLMLPINDIIAEISAAASLQSATQNYAESAVHGTAPVRFTIVGHAGNLIRGSYTGMVPLVFDLAVKRARYCGAGNGLMKNGQDYSEAPLNQLTTMKNVNNTWMTQVAKESVWGAGVNFVQYTDRATLFFPAFQTAYPIKNSVLTSEILMQIAVDVTKICEIVWRTLSGDSRRTPAEFIEESNRLFTELVEGRYDDRVIVTPETFFTAADEARGYSWEMNAIIYGNVMKTVGTMNVVVRRQA